MHGKDSATVNTRCLACHTIHDSGLRGQAEAGRVARPPAGPLPRWCCNVGPPSVRTSADRGWRRTSVGRDRPRSHQPRDAVRPAMPSAALNRHGVGQNRTAADLHGDVQHLLAQLIGRMRLQPVHPRHSTTARPGIDRYRPVPATGGRPRDTPGCGWPEPVAGTGVASGHVSTGSVRSPASRCYRGCRGVDVLAISVVSPWRGALHMRS